MAITLHLLRLEQTQRSLEPYAALKGKTAPPGGWLRAVRESLGRTLRTQAAQLGMAATTLHKSEVAEVEGRISLAQLRKLAAGLDCEVVYAIVPRQSLLATVEAQAERLARQEVLDVSHSMGLEAQRPSDPFVEQQIAQRRLALLAGSWSRLWK
jgi:predicted DNA-binding mobile mystery protein A